MSEIPDLFIKDPGRDLYLDYNYVLGFGNEFVVSAYQYLERIELIRKNKDNTFTPELTIIGTKKGEQNLDLNIEERGVYIQNIFCGDQYIYLLFLGKTKGTDSDSFVEIFDYNRDPVSIIPLDRKLSMIFVDEAKREIYGLDADQGAHHIYLYHLPDEIAVSM